LIILTVSVACVPSEARTARPSPRRPTASDPGHKNPPVPAWF